MNRSRRRNDAAWTRLRAHRRHGGPHRHPRCLGVRRSGPPKRDVGHLPPTFLDSGWSSSSTTTIPRTRKRFSYAHEYAHALLDRKSTSAIVSSKENSQEFIERRANAFAAAFLMPAEGVRWFLELLEKGGPSRRYRVTYTSAGDEPVEAEERPAPGSQQITYQDVVALAHHFGVSYPAAVYRLSDLGYINAEEKTSLIEKSDLGSRLFERMDDSI